MSEEVWKEYEGNLLTHSAAHYLMTIKTLLEDQGYARVTDIAKRLNITRGSCSISLKPLKKRGFVLEDHNKFLFLSETGRHLAEIVERNDELLEKLFADILGVDPAQAEIDACKIEHLISIETSVKLRDFIEFVSSGRKSVKEFMKALERHHPSCSQEVHRCTYCEDTCYFEVERESEGEARRLDGKDL